MADSKKRILLVEDQIDVAEIIRDYLIEAGYSVDLIHTGEGVVDSVRTSPPQLLLLDLMLPKVDGITICKEIRTFSEVPVIMLTAKVDEIDRMLGYELGADDYICKPVNPREVLMRVNAVLRRSEPLETQDQIPLEMDESRLLARYHGERLDLTKTEFRLLKLLSGKEGKIFSRQQIREKIYDTSKDSSDRAVDTCVKKLRSKMSKISEEDNPVQAVYGVGYKFERTDSL